MIPTSPLAARSFQPRTVRSSANLLAESSERPWNDKDYRGPSTPALAMRQRAPPLRMTGYMEGINEEAGCPFMRLYRMDGIGSPRTYRRVFDVASQFLAIQATYPPWRIQTAAYA